MPATAVAISEHHGDPATVQRFIAWRRGEGLSPKVSATYNIFHSDPRTTPLAEYRLRDFPLYCQRVSFFPDVPEHEAVTDLFLPLR